MKKQYIIAIIISIIIVIAGISFFAVNMIIEEGKKYEVSKIENSNYFILKQNNRYGVINKEGKTIIEPEYDVVKIPNPEKAIFICYQKETSIVLNDKSEKVFLEYQEVEPIRLKNIVSEFMYEKDVLRYKEDGKYGLLSFDGKQITKPIYEEIDSLTSKEGELLVKQNEKYGIINIKGNTLVKTQYDEISIDKYYTEQEQYKNAGYIVAVKTEDGYRYGYVNKNGKEILKPEYNEISRITEIKDEDKIYLIAAKNGQYGVYERNKEIIKNEYQSIDFDATDNLLIIERNKKFGVANLDGEIKIPIEYMRNRYNRNLLICSKRARDYCV